MTQKIFEIKSKIIEIFDDIVLYKKLRKNCFKISKKFNQTNQFDLIENIYSMNKRISIVGSNGIPSNYGGFETLVEFIVKNKSERVDYTVYCSKRNIKH